MAPKTINKPAKKLTEKKKPGRLKVTIDWVKVDYLLQADCSGVEVAAYLGIHENTLYGRCRTDKNMDFVAYSQEKRASGDSLLKVKMFETAIKDKNVTMEIWLSKQRLGYKDKTDVTTGGEKINSAIPSIEVTLSPEVIEKLKK